MPLCEAQVVPGAIVDHMFDLVDERSGHVRQRPLVRRGIIARVDIDPQTSAKQIFVQFKPDKEPELMSNHVLTFHSLPIQRKAERQTLDTMPVMSETASREEKNKPPVLVDEMNTMKRKPSYGASVSAPSK